MDFGGRDALLYRLTNAEREIVFLVGAPLTAPPGSGLGVPGVAAMVERIRGLFPEASQARRVLDQTLASAENRYQAAFRHVLQFCGPDAANTIIREAVLEARVPLAPLPVATACGRLENDLDGWSYPPGVAALGQLVARYPEKFGGTVLTTNFDPLVELAIRRAGGRAYSTVLHGDGNLEMARGEGCHVVHLHGYWYGTDTLHSPTQLGQDRPQLRASLGRLLRDRTVVVMAYGGWDDVFTRTLQEVIADLGSYPDVLWCFYPSDGAAIEGSSGALLGQLGPALARSRATLYNGINCHEVLPAIVAELRGASGVERGSSPVREDAGFGGREAQRAELLQAIERGQPVQLLGARRMGKSSLLCWIERTVRALGKPVAFVNARGLERRSPSDLVMAAAEALDKRAAVREVLYATHAVPGAEDAARALRLLAPACLLVDEADALAEAGHGFDRGFFDALRALGQEQRIQWISASERDLFELFSSTGLTSAFLNDARKVCIGALSRAEAEAFLREQVADVGLVAFAYELAGGFPSALGWLGERFRGGVGDRGELERELKRWIAPLFALWWQRLNEGERGLLKRGVGEGIAVEGLGDVERRGARRLVDAGFMSEDGGRFVLGGRAWGEFVRDVGE